MKTNKAKYVDDEADYKEELAQQKMHMKIL
jgi:hypothetical protein